MPAPVPAPEPAPTDVGDISSLIASDVTTPAPISTPSIAEPEPVLEDPPTQTVQVLVPKEKVKVKDFDEWEGHFDNEWSGAAAVYEGDNATPEPEEKFDDLAWDANAQPVKTIPKLPLKSAMGKMKKGELVILAEDRGIASDGTKAVLIDRLLSPDSPASQEQIESESPAMEIPDSKPEEVVVEEIVEEISSLAIEEETVEELTEEAVDLLVALTPTLEEEAPPQEEATLDDVLLNLTQPLSPPEMPPEMPPSAPLSAPLSAPPSGPGPMPPAGPPSGPGPMPPSGPPSGPGPMPPSGPPSGPGPMPPSGPPSGPGPMPPSGPPSEPGPMPPSGPPSGPGPMPPSGPPSEPGPMPPAGPPEKPPADE
jgi:hypothetical protein